MKVVHFYLKNIYICILITEQQSLCLTVCAYLREYQPIIIFLFVICCHNYSRQQNTINTILEAEFVDTCNIFWNLN